MKTQWTLISALVFALITAIFAVINVEPVQVNFLFTQTNTPLILVILSSTLLGGLIVGLIGIIRQYKQQRTIRQLTKELAEARASIHDPNHSNDPQAPDEPITPLPDSEGQAPSGQH